MTSTAVYLPEFLSASEAIRYPFLAGNRTKENHRPGAQSLHARYYIVQCLFMENLLIMARLNSATEQESTYRLRLGESDCGTACSSSVLETLHTGRKKKHVKVGRVRLCCCTGVGPVLMTTWKGDPGGHITGTMCRFRRRDDWRNRSAVGSSPPHDGMPKPRDPGASYIVQVGT